MSASHKMTTKDKLVLGITLAAIFGGVFLFKNRQKWRISCNSWKTGSSRSRARTLRNPSFEGIPESNTTFIYMYVIG